MCCARSRSQHSSRRHLQQQVGCSLRGQRNLSLARLRSRQQERLMILPVEEFCAPLPAARGAARLRAHPQLRLSQANRRRAAFLPLCFRLLQPSDASASSRRLPVVRTAHSLAVAMSALRRDHASCRAPLRRATPPPISASSQPVRRMNPHLQPRISLVLRRAHWFPVSHSSERSLVLHPRLSDVPPYDHSLCHQQLKRKRTEPASWRNKSHSPPGAVSFKPLYLKRPYTASQLPVLRSGALQIQH